MTTSQSIAWRLRVKLPSTLGVPDGPTTGGVDGAGAALVASSLTGVGSPYIGAPPQGDGAQIDIISGAPTTASYLINVIDASASDTPAGNLNAAAGIVTSILGDAQGRNQLLSRRAYIEFSADSGATWSTLCAGFVNRLQLLTAATYRFSIGETRRLETATTIFQTIQPQALCSGGIIPLDGGTCVLGGPIGGTPQAAPQAWPPGLDSLDISVFNPNAKYALSGAPWDADTHYTPGMVASTSSGEWICIAGNTNTPPPEATYWEPVPAGLVPSGAYNGTTGGPSHDGSYPIASVVVALDSQAYVSIAAVPSGGANGPPNVTYWIPLWSVILPSWGMVQDFGGVDAVVSTLGGNLPAGAGHPSNAFEITVQGGWFKIPVKGPGDPTWAYRAGNAIPKDFASANNLIPSLCAQYGTSPIGYGGTYINPWAGAFDAHVPKNVATQFQSGAHDSVLGGLGWTIGGIALQITLPNGQCVTVGAYPQFYNVAIEKGARYTATPVLIYPKARTIRVDWHDFYRIDPTTYLPVLPLDQNGNSVALPAFQTLLKLRAVVVPISSTAPLHIAMHPLDLLTACWSNAGVSYNSANVQALRAAMGANLVLVLQITQSMTIDQMFQQWIAGPYGLALRISEVSSTDQWGNVGTGFYELVDVRTPPTALPATTWTDADCYAESGAAEPLFDLDETTICETVQVNWATFVPWDPSLDASRPLDDVVPIPSQATYVDTDFAAYGSQQTSYTMPGGFTDIAMQSHGLMSSIMQAKSAQIFELTGRGLCRYGMPILATSPQAALGDLVLVNSIRMPNPATNVRGGYRLARVVKKTRVVQGVEYELVDLGASSTPASPGPTFTLALDPADNYHVVDVTITNLATLMTDFPTGSLSVQYALGATAPGTGMGGVTALDAPMTAASTVFALPAVPFGTTVWVRMNVRPGGGLLPSPWTSWASLVVAIPGPISALAWLDQGNGQGVLSWVNGDATTPIEVWLATGAAVSYIPTPTTVVVVPASASVNTGDTTPPFTAVVTDQLGNPMTTSIVWSSDTPADATVDAATGVVTGVAAGGATITATAGTATGTATVTVVQSLVVGSIVVAPAVFTSTPSSRVQFTATVYSTTSVVMTSYPTLTWGTTFGSIDATGLATMPATPEASITITATIGAVNGTASGACANPATNLAQAFRASGRKFLLTLNQAYPGDNFATVAGATNTTLGLPPIKSNYGTFTPGLVDGKSWAELVDINSVLAFTATTTAATANQAAIASLATQMWVIVRVRCDEIRALALSTGAALFCIGSTPTTNKKLECYIEAGGTANNFQLTAAAYETGSVRTTVCNSGFFSTLPPNGCCINCVVRVDTSSAAILGTYVYTDDARLLASNTAALSTALNTDGGANGALFLNLAFNQASSSGPTKAMVYGGLAVVSGVMPAAPANWQEPTAGTTGLLAWYPCGPVSVGTTPTTIVATFTGTAFTVTGTATSIYDNGGPNNWGLFGVRPGGEGIDENHWREHYTITAVTSPTAMTFATPYDPTVVKCRSLGISSRAYLLEGTGYNSVYGTVITSSTTATQALQTIVTGIVARCVTTYGHAAEGGIRVWNINEFVNGGSWIAGTWQQRIPGSNSTAGWVATVAGFIHTADPTAIIMFNFNNIHMASESAQKTACLDFVTNILAETSIPAAQVMIGLECHADNVTIMGSTDQSDLVTFLRALNTKGVLWGPSEFDITDRANQNPSGSSPATLIASRPARNILANTQTGKLFSTSALGDATALPTLDSVGCWGLSSLINWINTNNLGVNIERNIDHDFEESGLLDENYNYKGGQGSSADMYTTVLTFAEAL